MRSDHLQSPFTLLTAQAHSLQQTRNMTDQTALDNVLLGEGVKQMQEISREEILKQIFGDIGELADGTKKKTSLPMSWSFI